MHLGSRWLFPSSRTIPTFVANGTADLCEQLQHMALARNYIDSGPTRSRENRLEASRECPVSNGLCWSSVAGAFWRLLLIVLARGNLRGEINLFIDLMAGNSTMACASMSISSILRFWMQQRSTYEIVEKFSTADWHLMFWGHSSNVVFDRLCGGWKGASGLRFEFE